MTRHTCSQRGAFTNPDMTLEQMVRTSSNIMRQMHLPEDLITQTAQHIPTLRRWKKG